ncbi:amylo-alpha-1,6-glucosidase [Nevskia soli]|uniref:amylo-alpha-1,6-glucosidase n=1 Tax=Nevskia soli TaxID=418856 RepID=UPI0004A6CE84|nr:amylo-alpha-1,6-glucosidase [Nevskia soli]
MPSAAQPEKATQSTPEENQSPDFHIAASVSLQERQPHTLKHGDTFAVFDHRGDIGADPRSPEGIYHNDTRVLSRLELLLEGRPPLLLSSMNQDDNAVFTADLSNPDFVADGKIALRRELIQLHRLKFVWNAACYERVLVRNFSEEPQRLRLTLRFAADFVDLFEVRGTPRKRRGRVTTRRDGDAAVTLRYLGLDEVERLTALSFDPVPAHLDTASAEFDLSLEPHESCRIFIRIGTPAPAAEAWSGRNFYRQMHAARTALRRSVGRATRIDSSNSLFNEVMRRSVSDLYMLVTDTPQGPYPYAGTPWYSTPFGRDGIITALMTLWLDPGLARGVLRFLAATQATRLEPERDAEPGKILHEMRRGEMARLREVPFERYYGSVDATPLFVLLLGEYYRRTGDLDTVRELWPNAEAALHWIDSRSNAEGFLEYFRMTDDGLANQGWKDSQDAIFHQDGRAATGPIALCEVQGYVYGARQLAAELAVALGLEARAKELNQQAETLRRKFEDAFWCEDLSIYALALDGSKQPCRVISSNAGQALLSGIASPERARRVAQTLLDHGSYSGWGIRTVALSAQRYNPMSYHNGSIWPHDNALIAMGFARYGLKDSVLPVFRGMYDAASYMEQRRLPELFCGFVRRRRNAPTQYPVACAPQAWASATMMALLQASIGLEMRGGAGEIRFDHPQLPDFIDELCLHGLRVGAGSADVMLRRHGDDVAVTVTNQIGAVKVIALY